MIKNCIIRLSPVLLIFLFLACKGETVQSSDGSDAPLLDSKRMGELNQIDSNISDAERKIEEIDRQKSGSRPPVVASGRGQLDETNVVDDTDAEENPVAERVDRETGELAEDLNSRAQRVLTGK